MIPQISIKQFISNARGFKGKKWSHGGRSLETGIDCTGLVIVSANQAGANIDDRWDYARGDEFIRLIRELKEHFDEVDCSWKEVKIGDLLVFRSREMTNHLGIYTGDGNFIHAYNGSGCVLEQEFKGTWRVDMVKVFRYKNFQD